MARMTRTRPAGARNAMSPLSLGPSQRTARNSRPSDGIARAAPTASTTRKRPRPRRDGPEARPSGGFLVLELGSGSLLDLGEDLVRANRAQNRALVVNDDP